MQEILKNQNVEMVSLKKSLFEANQKAQNLATTIVENASISQIKQKSEQERETRDEE